ncbi:hypothetical protein BP6252_11852 [Coleophoma cylindrospora]|uniref:CENP-V/GFA domain-containing protein n=1 Tax=Coleophoma cylindrospora TaxID=1849047 RepID=A0A3D8QKU9_9HELO|nr:hypothetical protein BP6252_11852 [Coleophoma cylindrospora]
MVRVPVLTPPVPPDSPLFAMYPSSSTHLTCLCGTITAPGSLLSDSAIPISTEICHCNTCRHTTGSLGASFPKLSSAPSQDILSKLTAYKSSEVVTRYFCSQCGCHCFALNQQETQWYCLGGIIEQNPSNNLDSAPRSADTIKISRNEFVLDTIDGGLAPILIDLNGRTIPSWATAPDKLPMQVPFELPHSTVLSLPNKSINTLQRPEVDSYLTAKCHCSGVSLLIKRANYTDSSGKKSRVIPSDPTKYLTYLCACRSCRLSTGVSLVPWSLIPPANIFSAHDPRNSEGNMTPIIFGASISSPDANPGLSLKYYWSSQDVCRSFCGSCGATVSYWCGQRPDELDLATGILRGEEGCMARRWLDWKWGRCSFTEESIDNEMSQAWKESAAVMEGVEG